MSEKFSKDNKKNSDYAALFRTYIAYLAKAPVEKLKKLLQEGKLRKEQAAEISYKEDGSIIANWLLNAATVA
ncbi:MAG: hypothetical protein WC364_09950 [Eubacteriales bacterium]|jgi:endonuclease III